ncbi:MAG TPA: antibiotic biosynthesis monooxygenase family protein [Steroidobacteraceae bacterium]|nr:antibiotic biosynthesis monooxygenase family protein [Steroidobacteraceae bacterium]
MTAYTYVWEFKVEPDRNQEFQRHYGQEGSWVRLFRQAPGYIQTFLLQDSADRRRFITIDRWQSAEAYQSFRAAYAKDYAELDGRCEALTASETYIGGFDEST